MIDVQVKCHNGTIFPDTSNQKEGSMKQVTLPMIQDARRRIKPYFEKTPLTQSLFLSDKYGLNIHLKMENLAASGSFKIRGSSNALLAADQKLVKKNGVLAASAGNHAQGVARTAKKLGVNATIFMPSRAPLIKVEQTKILGAHVIQTGDTFDEAEAAAIEWNQSKNAVFIHPFSDPNVIAGQGTAGLEILEDMPELGAVVIPIGGGGLISGVACAIKELKPDTIVIGVQAKLYDSLTRQFHNEKQSTSSPGQSIADGIAVKKVNGYTFAHIEKYVDEIWSVGEDEIAASIMDLMEREHVLSEGAGAVGVAALEHISSKLSKTVGTKPIVCLISGGNIDVSLLNRITKRGLLYSGRIMRLVLSIDDRPGILADLLSKISETGANLYNIEHNRVFSQYGIKNVEVSIDLETINKAHQASIKTALEKSGYNLKH